VMCQGFTCALSTAGGVKCVGMNSVGQVTSTVTDATYVAQPLTFKSLNFSSESGMIRWP
jgi:hypothetical protein